MKRFIRFPGGNVVDVESPEPTKTVMDPETESLGPYRFWATYAPFRKDGTPVLGTFGKTAKQVVIFDAEEFKRLCREIPALATVKFEMGEF